MLADTFGDEAHGEKASNQGPIFHAQLPVAVHLGWLHDLRAGERLGANEPAKWAHLARVIANSPHGSVSAGAERALSAALVSAFSVEEERRKARQDGWNHPEPWGSYILDALIAEDMLKKDPLLRAASIDAIAASGALGSPPPLPDPNDPNWLPQVLQGAPSRKNRLEAHESLLVFATRSAAVGARVLDPKVRLRRVRELGRHRLYLVGGRAGDRSGFRQVADAATRDLLREDLGRVRSLDLGHPLTIPLLERARRSILRPTHEELIRSYLEGGRVVSPRSPGFVEHDDRESEHGQAADMAAGWARQEYLLAATHAEGIRRVCHHFAGLVFNHRLYQRA